MDQTIVKKSGEALVQKFDWGQLTWFASRELGNSTDVTVGQCRIRPGQANPRHFHPNCSEVLVVLEGRISHSIENDGTVEMAVGDCITVPPHLRHQARNIGDGDAVLMVTFSSADRKTVGE